MFTQRNSMSGWFFKKKAASRRVKCENLKKSLTSFDILFISKAFWIDRPELSTMQLDTKLFC